MSSPRIQADLVEPVRGDDGAPLALGAEVCGAHRVASLGWPKPVVNGEARPRGIHVDVVGVGHERHELRAGRTSPHLGDGEGSVRAPEPLHVRQPRLQAQRCDGVGGDAGNVGVLGSGDIARQQDAPLDPWVLEHVERSREIATDGVPDQPAIDHNAVKRVLGPGHELLEQHRVAGAGRRRCEPLLQLLGPVDPDRVPRARPASGLATNGNPTRPANARTSSSESTR